MNKQEALDKKAENARELGLDYEPVIDESAAKRIATALGWEPKRKPLTDEEIQKCYETTGHYQTLRPQDRFAVFALARAIEAAHGIKGEA